MRRLESPSRHWRRERGRPNNVPEPHALINTVDSSDIKPNIGIFEMVGSFMGDPYNGTTVNTTVHGYTIDCNINHLKKAQIFDRPQRISNVLEGHGLREAVRATQRPLRTQTFHHGPANCVTEPTFLSDYVKVHSTHILVHALNRTIVENPLWASGHMNGETSNNAKMEFH